MGLFRKRCPVGDEARQWIEESMRWFLEEFGEPPEIVLPTPVALLDGEAYVGSEANVRTVLASLCEYTAVEPDLVALEQVESDGGRDHYRREGGRTLISVTGFHVERPFRLIARISHELCHIRLLGDERISPHHEDQEPLTDLLTVYLGLGICTANASYEVLSESANAYGSTATRYHIGYLGEAMFGYGLACYAWLRGERSPTWADYLDYGPRVIMRNGLGYLADAAKSGTLTSW